MPDDALAEKLREWSAELGFQQLGITDTHLHEASSHFDTWLKNNYHGEMEYMAKNLELRKQPERLHNNTFRIISVRMDYLPETGKNIRKKLSRAEQAYVSCYAHGRDYHKLLRKRLQRLADRISDEIAPHGYRVFVDSAPVLEKALAEKAGLGWIGKHTNLINRQAGSWFFLGEIFTDMPLPIDTPDKPHCGKCQACIDICPTQAIIAPYQLDARRCISYLTIELRESIPEQFRTAIGNRIYGCDDCQLICPWNKYAKLTAENDFLPRNNLDRASLLELFQWTEKEFLDRMAGSPIRRIGYQSWQRNIAVAIGNAPHSSQAINALQAASVSATPMVLEHIQWALNQQYKKASEDQTSPEA